jgi:hypothetical protein
MANFKEIAHQQYGWDPQDFEQRLFLKCLDPGARVLARLLWPWRNRFFRQDFAALSTVANLTSYNDVFDLAQNLSDSRSQRRFLRHRLGIRPRGRHLLALARELLPGRRPQTAKVEPAYRLGSPMPKPQQHQPPEHGGPTPAPLNREIQAETERQKSGNPPSPTS